MEPSYLPAPFVTQQKTDPNPPARLMSEGNIFSARKDGAQVYVSLEREEVFCALQVQKWR